MYETCLESSIVIPQGMNKGVGPDPEPFSVAGGSGAVAPCSYRMNNAKPYLACETARSGADRATECTGEDKSDIVKYHLYPRGSVQPCEGSGVTACIYDIFSRNSNIGKLGEHVLIYPGVTCVRNRSRLVYGKSSSPVGGKKKPILSFSDKSRRNMMVTMNKIEEPFKFWQDLTFADDVMLGKSISERAKFSSLCMKKLKSFMEKSGLQITGIWKREYVKRKSGELVGQYIPHFHVVYSVVGIDIKEFYIDLALELASKWIEITGTEKILQASLVARNRNSYRFINSRKQMQKYMSKYLVKNQMPIFSESIGRNWGRIGKLKIETGEVVDVTEKEMILLKRVFRHIARKPRGFFKTALNQPGTKFFIFIEGSAVIRYLEWLRVTTAFDGVPF